MRLDEMTWPAQPLSLDAFNYVNVVVYLRSAHRFNGCSIRRCSYAKDHKSPSNPIVQKLRINRFLHWISMLILFLVLLLVSR